MTRCPPTLLAALCILAAVATPATAADAARGRDLAGACITCHGPDGNSINPVTPKLAGQNELYLVRPY